MITLNLLGRIELKDASGEEMHSLLRQTKHVALLAYLSLPNPGTWHRRDSLIATFWPEMDQSHGRGALRSALYTLRNHLPDDVIRTRGDEELCVNADAIETDVAAMNADFNAGNYRDALNRYQGELAPALFVDDSPAFERWLDGERNRAIAIAKRSASALTDQLEKTGDLSAAISAARRASEIDPDDEAAVRRWIALLDRAGDRSQAFAVYERFRDHMSESFGVRPSAETVALLDRVRTRNEANPDAIAPAHVETIAPQRKRGVLWLALLPLISLLALGLAYRAFDKPDPAHAAPASISVSVLPMRNETGDPSLDYLSSGITDGITRRLSRIAGVTVTKGKARVAFATSLSKVSDSLEVTANIDGRPLKSQRFTLANIADAEVQLATSMAGEVLRKPLAELPRPMDARVDSESYRLTLQGWYTLLANAQTRENTLPPRELRAQELFKRATDIDRTNSRAVAGLASTWASLAIVGEVPFSEGFERASANALGAIALDSLEGSAWANLGIVRGFRNHDLASGLAFIDRGLRAEPSNAELYLIRGSLLRTAHRYDEAREAMEMARALAPLSTTYLNQRANVEFCDNKPERALRIFEDERRVNPNNQVALTGSIRALVLLKRFPEAAALWRRQAELMGNSALLKELAAVKDSNTYWSVVHRQGRKKLAAATSDPSSSAMTLIRRYLDAGLPDSAYRVMDAMPAADRPPLYRLACLPSADEYRDTPKFKEASAKFSWN